MGEKRRGGSEERRKEGVSNIIPDIIPGVKSGPFRTSNPRSMLAWWWLRY